MPVHEVARPNLYYRVIVIEHRDGNQRSASSTIYPSTEAEPRDLEVLRSAAAIAIDKALLPRGDA